MLTRRSKLLWTAGNLCMLVGLVVLLYVGGVYANDEYGRYAARGDTDVPAPATVEELESAEPAPFVAPILSQGGAAANNGQVVGAVPVATAGRQSSITRIVIPSIDVDSKVVEVGWDEQEQKGQRVAVWQVAKYAVGQHRGSANPGQGDNIVLAGHVGGYGKVFKDLFYIKPGDQVVIYSDGQEYLYTVQEQLLVTEEGVSAEQHAANAQLIAPTGSEVVTLITCWPPSGPDKYKQRVVVRAAPFSSSGAGQLQSSWTIR